MGDSSCNDPFAGPICEACNINKGFSMISKSTCMDCNKIQGPLIFITILFLMSLVYIVLSTDSAIKKIKAMNNPKDLANPLLQNRYDASIIIKLFVGYLQYLALSN